MKRAAIVSIGNELLSGKTVDTNAAWLGGRMLRIGMPTVAVNIVGDVHTDILDALRSAEKKADIIITTGGLGPTDDDITRNAVAELMGVELEFRPEVFAAMEDYFRHRRYPMSEKNRVQAYLPVGAKALANTRGTAAGIRAEHSGKMVFSLPGVPGEMKKMFTDSVEPVIKEFSSGQTVLTRTINCLGAGESDVAQRLGGLMDRSRNPLINCTCGSGIIALHIIASADDRAAAENMIEQDEKRLREILGNLVFGVDSQTIAEVVGKMLLEKNASLALAESCTGGLIAKLITDVPGSSGYFKGGWVSYSNEMKNSQLDVNSETIEKYGAVSSEVAEQMAKGAKNITGADYAVSVTGIAGPGGGTEQKPVGLVYICTAGEDFCDVNQYIFPHSREFVRLRTALTALNLLRLKLMI